MDDKVKKLSDEAIEYFSELFETEYPKLLFFETTFIKAAIHLYEEKLKSCSEFVPNGLAFSAITVKENPEYYLIKSVIKHLKNLLNNEF